MFGTSCHETNATDAACDVSYGTMSAAVVALGYVARHTCFNGKNVSADMLVHRHIEGHGHLSKDLSRQKVNRGALGASMT